MYMGHENVWGQGQPQEVVEVDLPQEAVSFDGVETSDLIDRWYFEPEAEDPEVVPQLARELSRRTVELAGFHPDLVDRPLVGQGGAVYEGGKAILVADYFNWAVKHYGKGMLMQLFAAITTDPEDLEFPTIQAALRERLEPSFRKR
jgi:hypothetical protein